jgi:hypothetical protein
VSEDVATQKDKIEQAVKKMADDYINKEFGHEEKSARGTNQSGGNPANAGGSGGKHNRNQMGGYYEEIANMTEIEARKELTEMWTEMRTLRIFWKTKEMLVKDKYEREIFILKKQLTSNACLWEQLAEGEKREKVLK